MTTLNAREVYERVYISPSAEATAKRERAAKEEEARQAEELQAILRGEARRRLGSSRLPPKWR